MTVYKAVVLNNTGIAKPYLTALESLGYRSPTMPPFHFTLNSNGSVNPAETSPELLPLLTRGNGMNTNAIAGLYEVTISDSDMKLTHVPAGVEATSHKKPGSSNTVRFRTRELSNTTWVIIASGCGIAICSSALACWCIKIRIQSSRDEDTPQH